MIAFDTESAETAKPGTINCDLHQIWIYAWAQVGKDFNARMSAVEREYRYVFWGKGLDIDNMKDAASIFPGTHDFRYFGMGEKDGEWLKNMLDRSITGTLQPMETNGLILMNVKYPGIKWNIDSHARSRALEEIHELFVSRETDARMLDEIERDAIEVLVLALGVAEEGKSVDVDLIFNLPLLLQFQNRTIKSC